MESNALMFYLFIYFCINNDGRLTIWAQKMKMLDIEQWGVNSFLFYSTKEDQKLYVS